MVSLLAVTTIPTALMYTDYAISNQPDTVEVKEELILPKVTIERLVSGMNKSVIEAYGEVNSPETLTLLGEVSGRVTWKSDRLKVGKLVKKGELLLRIEDSDYQSSLADSNKALADANLVLLQEKRKHQRAHDNWKRSEISDKPSQLALREPQLAIAQTQYIAAKKAVEHAKKNLANTQIYAPFDAVITSRSVTNGSYISSGSSIATLEASNSAEIKIALSENEWQQLPTSLNDLNIQISLPNRSGSDWSGRASDLSLVIEQSTRTRTLTIEVDEPLSQRAPLLFGSFVKVTLEGKVLPDSYAISSSSLTADGYIWLEREDLIHRYKASILFANANQVSIARGELEPEINLVKKPLSHYVDGMQVVAYEDSSNAQQ